MLQSHQVKQVYLRYMTLGGASSEHLAAWLSGLPDLTKLTLYSMKLADTFAMTAEKAAQAKVSHAVTHDSLNVQTNICCLHTIGRVNVFICLRTLFQLTMIHSIKSTANIKHWHCLAPRYMYTAGRLIFADTVLE